MPRFIRGGDGWCEWRDDGKEGGVDGIPVKYDMNLLENNELYNLVEDPKEKNNVYDEFPEVASKLEELSRKARIELGDNITGIKGKGNREDGK